MVLNYVYFSKGGNLGGLRPPGYVSASLSRLSAQESCRVWMAHVRRTWREAQRERSRASTGQGEGVTARRRDMAWRLSERR